MTWRSHFQMLISIYLVVYLETIESFDKVMDLDKNSSKCEEFPKYNNFNPSLSKKSSMAIPLALDM